MKMKRLGLITIKDLCSPIKFVFQFVDSKLSKKILSAARKQKRELEDEFGPTPAEAYGGAKRQRTTKLSDPTEDSSDNDESEAEDTLEPDSFYENIEINEEDEKALELFMSENPQPRRTLADIIMEKITEKQTELQSQFSDAQSMQLQDIDPRVKQMYEGVRDVLRKYRSGKIPKAFKIVPNLRNWEQILFITGMQYIFIL